MSGQGFIQVMADALDDSERRGEALFVLSGFLTDVNSWEVLQLTPTDVGDGWVHVLDQLKSTWGGMSPPERQYAAHIAQQLALWLPVERAAEAIELASVLNDGEDGEEIVLRLLQYSLLVKEASREDDEESAYRVFVILGRVLDLVEDMEEGADRWTVERLARIHQADAAVRISTTTMAEARGLVEAAVQHSGRGDDVGESGQILSRLVHTFLGREA
jgi:hypothetical protein